MKRVLSAGVGVFFFVVAISCESLKGGDSGSPGTGASADVAGYCAAICGKQKMCDGTVDKPTCTNQCSNALAAVGAKLRGEYLGAAQTCYLAKDCQTVLNNDPGQSCSEEAVASIGPSPVGVAYCDAYVAAAQTCMGTANRADCLTGAKTYSDAALNDAKNCFKRPCGEMDACIAAALGSSSLGDLRADSCDFANDLVCDEPDICPAGTDSTDCGRGGGGGGGGNSTDVAGYCAGVCGKDVMCGLEASLQSCVNECTVGLSFLTAYVRQEYLGRLRNCLAAADCASVANGAAGDVCSETTLAAIAVTTAITGFCDAIEAKRQTCLVPVTRANCLTSVKIFNDAVLNTARACFSQPCAAANACANLALGTDDVYVCALGNASCQ